MVVVARVGVLVAVERPHQPMVVWVVARPRHPLVSFVFGLVPDQSAEHPLSAEVMEQAQAERVVVQVVLVLL